MSADGKWTTQDGRTLEVIWMDSVHLVHSMNMMLRKGRFTIEKAERIVHTTLSPMRDELRLRGLWNRSKSYNNLGEPHEQLAIPLRRETLKELCMWRACVDCGEPYTSEFRQIDPSVFMEHIQGSQNPVHAKLLAKFVAYRLERS